jgi:hypothetical protein
MRISTSRAIASCAGIAAAACILFAVPGAQARSARCEYRELPRVSTNHPYVYGPDGTPWVVTVDELAGKVQLASAGNPISSCGVALEAVKRVYISAHYIALRSIEISSDDIFFFDPVSCRQVRKAVHLGVTLTSDQATPARLAKLHFCELPRKSAPGVGSVKSNE